MFLVTGDCHQEYNKIFDLAKRINFTNKDTILVLGDMGLFWRKDKRDARELIPKLEEVGCNIWFIDGNHENFDHLLTLPAAADIGRYVSEHIRWIPRGTEFYVNNKRCLAIGGADSIDKNLRTPHLSWWKEEQLTNEETKVIADAHMGKHFEYVFSHAVPRYIFEAHKSSLCGLTHIIDDESTINHTTEDNLQFIENHIYFNKWFFGHYHQDKELTEKFTCLYHTFEEIK